MQWTKKKFNFIFHLLWAGLSSIWTWRFPSVVSSCFAFVSCCGFSEDKKPSHLHTCLILSPLLYFLSALTSTWPSAPGHYTEITSEGRGGSRTWCLQQKEWKRRVSDKNTHPPCFFILQSISSWKHHCIRALNISSVRSWSWSVLEKMMMMMMKSVRVLY